MSNPNKKTKLILYLGISAVTFLICVVIFISTYFRMISRAFNQPGAVGREFAAYDSWSGILMVFMCVSGVAFYVIIRLLIKKPAKDFEAYKKQR